jgi:hypothetical protein
MNVNYLLILILLIILYYVSNKKEHFSTGIKRVFISYIYYETAESKDNFEYFLNNGGIIESNDIDYLITINGNICSLNLPKFKNVKYNFKENKCYDIGSHGIALKKINIDNYDYFILMNDTVKGPYLKNKNSNWINIFTSKINNKCKLYGIEKSDAKSKYDGFPPKIVPKRKIKFVGSMLLCTDKIGLNIIKPYLNCKKNHNEAVWEGEHLISDSIVKNNFEIDAILKKHHLYYDTKKSKYQTIFYKVNNACKKCKKN